MSSFIDNSVPHPSQEIQPTYVDMGLDQTGARLLRGPDGKIIKGYDWHRTQLTVDLIVIDVSTGTIGLIKRKFDPFQDSFALPGGFADLVNGEDIDIAVTREAKEEINFMGGTLQRATFRANATRDPRGYTATCVYTIQVTSREGFRAGDDASDLFWIRIEDLKGLTPDTAKTFAPIPGDNVCGFAFDHFDILQEMVRKDDEWR